MKKRKPVTPNPQATFPQSVHSTQLFVSLAFEDRKGEYHPGCIDEKSGIAGVKRLVYSSATKECKNLNADPIYRLTVSPASWVLCEAHFANVFHHIAQYLSTLTECRKAKCERG